MSDNSLPPSDHNNPPLELPTGEALKESLNKETAALQKRLTELLKAGENIPAKITTDEQARDATDYVKLCNALIRSAELLRTSMKGPYLTGGQQIDGYFSRQREPLEKIIESISGKRTGRLALYLLDKEKREREEREAREKVAREEQERLQKIAAEAEANIETEADLAAAIDSDQAARDAGANVAVAEKAADAKASELGRVRGEYGSLSHLRETWEATNIDRATLDLEALRPYLSTDAIEKAVRAYIRAGNHVLKGATIEPVKSAVVR